MFSSNKSSAKETVAAGVTAGGSSADATRAGGVFTVQCHGEDGALKWEASKHNLVVNAGLQDMNAKYFLGSSYTATWYLGLYGAAASNDPAVGDTMASHAGWTEEVGYTQATRPACSFGTATTADPSVITNALAPAQFSMNATATIGGAFLTSDNTKSGTAGVLFSAADFGAPGDRDVVSGDTLSVTYTFNLAAT